MAISAAKRQITVEEYYQRERLADFRSEYFDGEIFAMAGSTIRHSKICTNLIGELRAQLKANPCEPFESNLRLRIQRTGLRCYPDASIFCDPLERDPEDSAGQTVMNPSVLFEVLSPTAEAYDRGAKANHFRQIKSLKAYVFVSQDEPHVEMYLRQPDGSWLFREFKGVESALHLPSINLELPLKEIYDRVDFSTPASLEF